MDYIYKDKDGKKSIGEISYLHITPFFEFEIEAAGQKIIYYLDHLLSEWNICISNYEMNIELAHPTDIFWNADAICEKIKDENLSLQIAYAIKEIYKNKNYSKDVL